MTHNTQFAKPYDEVALIESWIAEAREEGREDVYAGKRRHPRIEWNVPVIVQSDATPDRSFYVTGVNISNGGMGLRCSEPLAPRSRVRLFVNDGADSITGIVRHCSSTVGGYMVGVEFAVEAQTVRLAKSA